MKFSFGLLEKLIMLQIIITIICITMREPAEAVQLDMSAANVVEGRDATFRCWAIKEESENLLSLTIESNSWSMHSLWDQRTATSTLSHQVNHKRFMVDLMAPDHTNATVVVSVANMACSDDGLYVCRAKCVRDALGSAIQYENSTSIPIVVTVPLTPPTITTTAPRSLIDMDAVLEQDVVELHCETVVGQREQPLSLKWTIHRGNESQAIGEDDSRIINGKMPGQRGPCTYELKTVLRFQALRNDQDCQVSCHLTPKDHQFKSTDFDMKDLITRTGPINLHYGVSEVAMSIRSSVHGAVTEGDTLLLICYADSFPLPVYFWTKVGSGEVIIPGLQVRDASMLMMKKIKDVDAGLYRCTASNVVLGNLTFSASTDYELIIDSGKHRHRREAAMAASQSKGSGNVFQILYNEDAAKGFILGLALVLAYMVIRLLIFVKMTPRSQPPPPPEQVFEAPPPPMPAPADKSTSLKSSISSNREESEVVVEQHSSYSEHTIKSDDKQSSLPATP